MVSLSNTKIIALIAARMGSSRFPKKTLAKLHGKPMLERMVERVRFSKNIDQIVIATTDLPEDDILESWAIDMDLGCFRGFSEDVLGRLKHAAEKYSAEVIVEMLGDNPLVHSSLIDKALNEYFKGEVDYVATVTNEYPEADKQLKRFSIGVRVQIFSYDTLALCEKLSKEKSHREHATSFIAENPEIFKTRFIEAKDEFSLLNRPELTFAVNYIENLYLIRKLFDSCYMENNNFTIDQAIHVYDCNTNLKKLMYPEKKFK